ncbi:MAG TPA: glycosyltransferase [Rhodanobacteraceae bacterium]|nr:glycosyltransferase [Rhodanobacteraceae bacterium]
MIAEQQAAIATLLPYREQLAGLTEAHAQLESDFEDRTRWAKKLDAELSAMYASTSWRITGPVRYLARKLRAARVRTAFAWHRLRTIAKRTRGSVASRGLFGTYRRIRDEFRRGTPLPLMLSIAEPAPDVEPFTLPSADVPLVSIVIPVYNKIDYTIACLRSLAEHAGAAAFEVIVVDDASSDTTAERLARVGGIRVIRNAQNVGFVGSCNAGAGAARGDFVLFLNNDTVVTSGWLEALLRCFDEEPDAGLVGAKLVYPDGRLQEAGGIIFADGSGWNYGRFDDPADPRYNFRREADYCSGAAILIRRELLGRLGGFDTRYAPAYYEDTDLAFAVRAAGLKVFYEPRAVVVHFEGVTAGTDTASGMKRFQVVNRDKFLEKWKNELTAQPAPIHEARLAPAAANWRARGRVLIADSYTPTPDQDSGSLRMVNLMRLLREAGYAVAFLPDNRSHDGSYTEALQSLGVEALYHPYVSDPVAWLREHGSGLDAIILSRHYVAVNYIGAARLYAPQARLIFDTVDLHYLREERAAELEGKPELARHAAQTKLQELKLMRECDVTLVVSSAEQRLLQKELPNARIEVLSNVHAVHGRRAPFEDRRDLVFVGGFQHPPNIDAVRWFAGEVMPLLRAGGAPPHLHVIGSKAPQEVLDLAGDDISVHGFVPDIAPYMDGCRLSVAPLRYGAGVKGKVNMAMSYGLPVVATSIAVEGMHVRAGVDVMVADGAAGFAAAIRRAYDDAALWTTLSDRGLANVREHFSFAAARTALARILP